MSNSTYTANETSFWKFIQENEIEIPIIQRDYAQGRLGKEGLRKNFLSDLKKALDNEKPYNDKAMKMDFVYGSVENEKMNPLDGQQRLTTLWLLHWYIALRANKLDAEIAGTLNRFSYETRISSREFCGNLCNPEHFKDFCGTDIVGFISRQTWFYSAWKQDPTIQAMLRMLGGTKVTDKKGKDIIDGIEELFAGTENFENYWEKLTTDNAPIVFYHLPLKDFGLSDDLYIKMNARGKQLTSFENFKADLVDYIMEQSNSELLDADTKKRWKSLLDDRDGIPIKMDTAWTDIFWRNKSKDNKIDEIYFAFLNRFFWDQLFMLKKEDDFVLKNDKENENSSYKYLNNSDGGQNVYDTTISYKELDPYKFLNGEIPYIVFEDFQKILNRYKDIIPVCPWDDSFRFIPAYEEDDNGESIEITDTSGEKILKVTYLNQVQRVVFHAVCKYFKEGEFDKASLKQWMRIVWNLVSGEDVNVKEAKTRPQIRSTSAMRSAMEFIDQLDSHNVYNCLTKFTNTLSDSEFDKRCKEEIAKAKQIVESDDGWESKIIEAENHAFFKGAIRFLFTDENGEINWGDFDTKWENARKFFDKDGVSEEYKESAILLRALLSRIDILERWFGNHKEFWREVLLSVDYSAIHELLMGGRLDVKEGCEDWIKDDHLLQELLSNYKAWHILKDWNGFSVLTRYSRREQAPKSTKDIVVLNYHRNALLNNQTIAINKDCIIDNTFFIYGWNINFKYKEKYFQWYGTPNETQFDVYLMEDNWSNYKHKKQPDPNTDKTDEESYYCFRVTEKMEENTDLFTKELESLIAQAYTDVGKSVCEVCNEKICGETSEQ